MAEISTRKRIWGWFFFDWASQPYHTVLNTFIFGPFFAAIAASYFLGIGMEEQAADAKAQATWAWSTAIYGLIIAFSAVINAMAGWAPGGAIGVFELARGSRLITGCFPT